MIIIINDKWRIGSDEYQWILQKCTGTRTDRKTGDKVPNWKNVGYFPQLPSLFNYLIKLRIWTHEGEYPPETLDPLTLFLVEMRTEISAALKAIQRDYRGLVAQRDENAEQEIVLCRCQDSIDCEWAQGTMETSNDTVLGSPPPQRR